MAQAPPGDEWLQAWVQPCHEQACWDSRRRVHEARAAGHGQATAPALVLLWEAGESAHRAMCLWSQAVLPAAHAVIGAHCTEHPAQAVHSTQLAAEAVLEPCAGDQVPLGRCQLPWHWTDQALALEQRRARV